MSKSAASDATRVSRPYMPAFTRFVIQVFTEAGETVLIAKIVKALTAELEKRAEAALRFGGR